MFTEDELIVNTKKKRRRIIVESDSDSDDNSNSIRKKNKSSKKAKVNFDSDTSDDDVGSSEQSQRSADLKLFKFVKTNNELCMLDKENLSSKKPKSFNPSGPAIPTAISDTNWVHNKLDFLTPHKIRDINKNRPDHPDYDARTLYVPDDFLNKQTPAMRQWWILKSKHFDSVLFFKVNNVKVSSIDSLCV